MIEKIIQSVIYLKYASDEIKDIYPELSLTLLELSQQLISENNINNLEVDEFQKLVNETINNEKELD